MICYDLNLPYWLNSRVITSLMMSCFLHVESSICDSFQVVVERSFQLDWNIVCWAGKANDSLVIHISVHAQLCILLMADIEGEMILFGWLILDYQVFWLLKDPSFCLKIMVLFVFFNTVLYMEDRLLISFYTMDSMMMSNDGQ